MGLAYAEDIVSVGRTADVTKEACISDEVSCSAWKLMFPLSRLPVPRNGATAVLTHLKENERSTLADPFPI
jgi:hypothetical protein